MRVQLTSKERWKSHQRHWTMSMLSAAERRRKNIAYLEELYRSRKYQQCCREARCKTPLEHVKVMR